MEEVSIDYDNEVAIYDDYYDDMYAIKMLGNAVISKKKSYAYARSI